MQTKNTPEQISRMKKKASIVSNQICRKKKEKQNNGKNELVILSIFVLKIGSVFHFAQFWDIVSNMITMFSFSKFIFFC